MVNNKNKYENIEFIIDKTNLEEIILFTVRGKIMKGLIIKDILNMKNYMKQLILVLIFFHSIWNFLENGTLLEL